ncbi:MAG: NlpC/P60 family peptidoglycan-binding protein RipD, partial [Mycobacterium sp.]
MRRIYAVTAGVAVAMTAMVANAGLANADPRPSGYGQPIDYVIQRALSQRGVPYVYGGGNASGPTNGVRQSTATGPGALPGIGTLPGTTAPGTGTIPGTAPGVGTIPGTAPG